MLYLKCARRPKMMTSQVTSALTIDIVWSANFSDLGTDQKYMIKKYLVAERDLGKQTNFRVNLPSVSRRILAIYLNNNQINRTYFAPCMLFFCVHSTDNGCRESLMRHLYDWWTILTWRIMLFLIGNQ